MGWDLAATFSILLIVLYKDANEGGLQNYFRKCQEYEISMMLSLIRKIEYFPLPELFSHFFDSMFFFWVPGFLQLQLNRKRHLIAWNMKIVLFTMTLVSFYSNNTGILKLTYWMDCLPFPSSLSFLSSFLPSILFPSLSPLFLQLFRGGGLLCWPYGLGILLPLYVHTTAPSFLGFILPVVGMRLCICVCC